ncbi:MAG TPA: cytochrome ubiquinol oxidase subunit I [Chlamydiales bacterium]|nr:cytochrome ubiquinol oxidase subunit I [Chlamydiales bacterium]
MDVVVLSRIQFAMNIAFHFIFPPLSIGLGLLLVIMEGMYLKTKLLKYKELTQFWINIFALTFAIGVATGLVQSFAFGTNWAKYSHFVGDVFGSALAAEGIFAFFLESGFLGILLFGWDRVKPGIHYFATIMVCLGAHFSALWILIANSWMQTPAGHIIEQQGDRSRAVIVDFWKMVFNPSSMDRIVHVVLGCWLAGIFFMISVAAYYFLKKRHDEMARSMMKIGLPLAIVVLILQLFSGDSSADVVAKHQPAKLAAFEGVFKTEPGTAVSVIGWVDTDNEKVYSLKIPGGLSFMTYGNFHSAVTGLDKFPKEDWPNVHVVFQTYHLMVWMWGFMVLTALFGLYYTWKKKLREVRWLLWVMVFSVIFPQVALQAGWVSAEMGRQPWIVYNILRTKDGVSRSISAGQVKGSITMFSIINLLLFVLFLFLLDRKIKYGPKLLPTEYRDVYGA